MSRSPEAGKYYLTVRCCTNEAFALFDRCWITTKPVYLRYALNHGWRLSFIVIEVFLSFCGSTLILIETRSRSTYIWYVFHIV